MEQRTSQSPAPMAVAVERPFPSPPPGPSYYERLDPQPLVVVARWGLRYPEATAVSYIARAGFKPGNTALDDLRKARAFIDWAIMLAEHEGP